MNPHIIIPVYNRKNVTLSCLNMLRPLIGSGWQVVVVDDGSTDGTAQAIAEEFPAVTMLLGNGDLFWTGAMELGMRHAIDAGCNCCVWLNDDLTLDERAIEQVTELAIERQAVVTGQGVIDLEDGSQWFFPLLYGDKNCLKAKEGRVEGSEPISVDSCRGNLVAIPRAVVERIGFPDGKNIPHAGGDTDYTLRATKAGFPCLTLPTAVFHEAENIRDDNRSWLLDDRSPALICRQSTSKRGSLYPRMLFTYYRRHWGLSGFCLALRMLAHFAAVLTLKILLPKSIRLKLFAHRSHAYQVYANRGIES